MPPKAMRDPPTPEQRRLEFAALWEQCLPRFRSVLIARVLGACGSFTNEQIDDLIAEVTAVLLSKSDEYDPSHGLIAWGVGCAKKLLANLPRRRRRERRLVPVSNLDSPSDIAVLDRLIDPAPDQPLREQLDGWLSQLPGPARLLIEGRFFQALGYDELAALIGVGRAATARVRLSRALKLLRSIATHDAGGAP